MGKFGRRPITDASKGQPKLVYHYNGSERIDRRPHGKCERFVDLAGNVMTVKLASDGDPNPTETIRRERAAQHRKGSVEHAKCPIRHGHNLIAGQTAKDFLKLLKVDGYSATPCDRDPARMLLKDEYGDIQAQKACPHIEALIAFRVRQEKVEAAKRNEHRAKQEERDERKRKLEEWQFEQAMKAKEDAERVEKSKSRQAQPRANE